MVIFKDRPGDDGMVMVMRMVMTVVMVMVMIFKDRPGLAGIGEKCVLKTIDIIIWFQETHWATVTEQWPLN